MKRRFLFDTWRKEPSFQALCTALLSCKTHEDMANALGDLLTLSEMKTVAERLEVAKLLAKGLSYRQAAAAAQASTTTVTKVAQKIENGTGGLRKILRVHRHYRDVPEIRQVLQSERPELAKGALQKALERTQQQ